MNSQRLRLKLKDAISLGLREQMNETAEKVSASLHLADPLAVVPDGFERGQIAAVEDVFGGGDEPCLF